MEGDTIEHWDLNEHCLFLLSPSHETFLNKKQEDFEFVPVATERRYADQAQQFVEQLLSPPFTVPAVPNNSGEPSAASLPKMSNRQPLSMASGNKPKTTTTLGQIVTVDNGFDFPILGVKSDSIGCSDSSKINANFKYGYTSRRELSKPFSSYSESEELLLPLVYNPEENVNTPAKRDIPKANDFFSTIFTDMDTPFGVVSSTDDMGFESMMREGCMPEDVMKNITNGYGSCIERGPSRMAATKTVNACQATYSQVRPEVQSVYADVYASNPFSISSSIYDDGDSSTSATLFPSKTSVSPDTSNLEDATPPDTPDGSSTGSMSDQSIEDDITAMTKDFHRALSSIAKEKSQPVSTSFGLSTKAMSLLGQIEVSKDAKSYNKVQNSIKKGSAPLDTYHDLNGDTSPRKVSGNSTTKEHFPRGYSTKLQSILGVNLPAPTAVHSSSTSDLSRDGPRTNSSLFEKLYSQVLKPSGTYYSGAEQETKEHHRLSSLGGFDGEPIKRASLSSHNGSTTCRMPFSSSEYQGHDKIPHSRTAGNVYSSSSEVTNSHKRSAQTQNYVPAFQHSLRDGLEVPDKSTHEVKEKNGDLSYARSMSSIRSAFRNKTKGSPEDISMRSRRTSNGKNQSYDDSEKSSMKSPYQQLQYLASVSEAINTEVDLDQGIPFKRPTSPVKKMFSSTVERIGRIIPANNNTSLASNSHEAVVNSLSELKISIHPADQNRLFGDLEYIIQDTANRFLLFQHSHGRLSPQSINKIVRDWRQKNRPQVTQFLYPISIQRKLVEQNLDTITFYGPLAGNATAISAIMHTWKYVAQELAVRSFCLPDAGLQHFLRETARLLELLGVTSGHMLHFQAWSNIVGQTVHTSYQTPYSFNKK